MHICAVFSDLFYVRPLSTWYQWCVNQRWQLDFLVKCNTLNKNSIVGRQNISLLNRLNKFNNERKYLVFCRNVQLWAMMAIFKKIHLERIIFVMISMVFVPINRCIYCKYFSNFNAMKIHKKKLFYIFLNWNRLILLYWFYLVIF